MKIIFRLLLVALFFVIVTKCHAQNSVPASAVYLYKGPTTTTAQDTAAIQSARTAYETSFGNTGGLFFNKTTDKLRFWNGSAWATVGSGNGSGTVTSVSGTSPISVATGTTTPVISMTAAGAATSGYVTSAAQTFGGVKTMDSPIFTSIPVAPTAAPGTNTTQLATTAFVQAAIPAIITASNGLTKTSNDIALGGTAANVDISDTDGTHTFNVGGDGFFTNNFNIVNFSAATSASLSGGTSSGLSGGSGSIQVTSTSVETNVIDNYSTDISGSYTTRSKVDKGYADTKLDGTMVSTLVPIGSDANTLTTDADLSFTGGTTLNTAQLTITQGAIISGTYTPTGGTSTNTTAITPGIARWMRVGNVVTVSGIVTSITVTSTGTTTRFTLSIPPVGANFGNQYDAAGNFVQEDTGLVGACKATFAAQTVTFGYQSVATGSVGNLLYHYTYLVN